MFFLSELFLVITHCFPCYNIRFSALFIYYLFDRMHRVPLFVRIRWGRVQHGFWLKPLEDCPTKLLDLVNAHTKFLLVWMPILYFAHELTRAWANQLQQLLWCSLKKKNQTNIILLYYLQVSGSVFQIKEKSSICPLKGIYFMTHIAHCCRIIYHNINTLSSIGTLLVL